jgi:phosphate starvation-inducible PhoH-like protein
MSNTSHDLYFEPLDNRRLANLCGKHNENLRQVEKHLGVEIYNRGNQFQVSGDAAAVAAAEKILHLLYDETAAEAVLTPAKVHLFLHEGGDDLKILEDDTAREVLIHTRMGTLKPHGANQRLYLKNIAENDINFGVGPAGTGKSYLAVACAVEALIKERVHRVILVRPAVEADPYLRPLYDALFEMLGFERVAKLIEENIIEVAPLAYMRGRTLNESFIILDESQNTTVEQMKMFLTRIGFGSKAVITGDITQVDLAKGVTSGLMHAIEVLKEVPDISFTYFEAKDAVRHVLVQRIIEAYESYKK